MAVADHSDNLECEGPGSRAVGKAWTVSEFDATGAHNVLIRVQSPSP